MNKPLVDKHAGHVVSSHTIQPNLEIYNSFSFGGHLEEQLHHVVNLLCPDCLIRRMAFRRK